jgi:hypothetical protein
MDWTMPGPDAPAREQVNALLQRARVLEILADHDPENAEAAREVANELRRIAVVTEVLAILR